MFTWDASALNNGSLQVFEYVAEYLDSGGTPFERTSGTMRIGDNAPAGIVQLRASYSIDTAGIFISREQEYNAFGEISAEVDGRGNRRDLSYNTLGLLTQKLDAEAAVTAGNGYIANVRGSTRQLYSLGGRLVRSTDANGNSVTFGYASNGVAADGSALLLWEQHFDGRKTWNVRRVRPDARADRRDDSPRPCTTTTWPAD